MTEHAGHRSRMRRRFAQNGLDGFEQHEVLELLLFYAIPQKNVNPLAHRLIDHFGTLKRVLDANVEELCKVDGMGPYASAFLSLVRQSALYAERTGGEQREELRNYVAAVEHCRRLLAGLRQEHFYVVCMDSQFRVIRDVEIASGTLAEVQAYPRNVADAVIRYDACAVVLCHNHPGGSVVPSQADLDLTAKLANMLDAMNVHLSDHIIVTDGESLSMKNCGLIEHRCDPSGRYYPRVATSAGEVTMRYRMAKPKTKE